MKQRGFLKATSVMSILFCMIVLYQLKQICDNEVKIFVVLYIYNNIYICIYTYIYILSFNNIYKCILHTVIIIYKILILPLFFNYLLVFFLFCCQNFPSILVSNSNDSIYVPCMLQINCINLNITLFILFHIITCIYT